MFARGCDRGQVPIADLFERNSVAIVPDDLDHRGPVVSAGQLQRQYLAQQCEERCRILIGLALQIFLPTFS
jgi:hypothetical protein